MEKTMLTIGEPFTLEAEQIAGVFAYKFAKEGYEVFISNHADFVSVFARKHETFNAVHFHKGNKISIAKADKLFEQIKRHLI